MPEKLTDEEVICEWMEPHYDDISGYFPGRGEITSGGWWIRTHSGAPYWKPIDLTLDLLHLVEARLTDEQWLVKYEFELAKQLGYLPGSCPPKKWIHATAAQKIAALAAVIRAERT